MKKSKILIITVLFTLITAPLQAEICYIPNEDGVRTAIQGEPVLNFYVEFMNIAMPTGFNTREDIANKMINVFIGQIPKVGDFFTSIFQYKGEEYVTSKNSFNLLLQFPDMSDLIEDNVGIHITSQRYMCTFEPLLMLDDEYSTKYYISNIEPARLLYLTPNGLQTLNIANDESEYLINAVKPWLPKSVDNLFNGEDCTETEITIYAVLPDLDKTFGKNSGYYRLTFIPDNSNLPLSLGGDDKKNGWYYLSDMELISVVPPLKYDGQWSWQGEDIYCKQELLNALPKPTIINGLMLLDVDKNLTDYLPCMTSGSYLLELNASNELVNYSALLSKNLNKLNGFPTTNQLNSIFNLETGEPIMDIVIVYEDNVGKIYVNMSQNNVPGYAAASYSKEHNLRFMYDYRQSYIPPLSVDEIMRLKQAYNLGNEAPKIYITGTVENAYSGGTESEGLLFFKGGENEYIHLYLENFNVKSMQDTQWDMTFGSIKMGSSISIDKMLYMRKSKDNNVFDLLGQGSGTKYTRGASSVLAFGSKTTDTDKPFNVCIHFKGDNTLTGGAQSYYSPYSIDYLNNNDVANCIVKTLLGLDIDVLVNIFAKGIARMVASPISVRPYAYNHDPNMDGMTYENILQAATKIRFDDYWQEGDNLVRQNGRLNLPIDYDTNNGGEYDHSAPSIDYGTYNSQVIFDGGQYTLTTAAKTTTALSTASHAIAHRSVKFDFNLSIFNSEPEPTTVVLPNTGTSIGRNEELDARAIINNVIIENGTFNTYSAEDLKSYIDVVTNGLYYAYTDLRLPYSTQINGGSFNCDAYRISDATQRGLQPIRSFGSNDTIVLCRQTKLYSELPTDKSYIELTDIESSRGNKFSYNYSVDNVQADDDVVHLYLPCTDQNLDVSDSYIQNYTTLFPILGIHGLMEVGGPVDVFTTYKGIANGQPLKNAYLMQYVPNMETIENTQITIGGIKYSMSDVMPEQTREEDSWAGTVRYSGTIQKSNLTPIEDYYIQYGIYMMRSYIGNQWYLFSPPYNVSKVYVVETSDIKYHGTSVAANLNDPAYIQYLKEQAASESTMLDAIFNQLMPDVTNTGVSGSGPLLNFIDFLKNIDGVNVTEIVHYNPTIEETLPGTNIKKHGSSNANYFLYHNDGENEFGDWAIKSSVNEYSNYWSPAVYTNLRTDTYINQNNQLLPTDEQRYLMQKDEIYAIYFPEGKDRFWDNKYIIFEGYGPQKLSGRNAFEEYFIESDESDYPNDILFQGLTAFANLAISGTSDNTQNSIVSANGYIWELDRDAQNMYTFSQMKEGDVIHSGDVYAIANRISNPSMVAQKDNIISEDEQHSLSQNIKLMAWEQSGLMIYSFAQQYVEIISTDGRVLWNGELDADQTKHFNVQCGVYIVHSENETIKVVVK